MKSPDVCLHYKTADVCGCRFGLFLLKNSSKEEDLGEYSMYTGEGDPYR